MYLNVFSHDFLQNNCNLLRRIKILPYSTNFQLTTTERVECLLDTVCCTIDLKIWLGDLLHKNRWKKNLNEENFIFWYIYYVLYIRRRFSFLRNWENEKCLRRLLCRIFLLLMTLRYILCVIIIGISMHEVQMRKAFKVFIEY
jgi:hypothetical protein